LFRQRLRLGFRVVGDQRFLSHLDTMRLWERALRRAGLPLRMSEGFNPRPRISLPEPRSVGVASDAEILEFELADWVSPDAILAGLSRQVPEGIRIASLDLVRPSDKARPAAVVYVADSSSPAEAAGGLQRAGPPAPPLRAVWPADLADRIARLLAADRLAVVRHRPTGDKPLDARPFIESLELQGTGSREPGTGRSEPQPSEPGSRTPNPAVQVIRMVLRTGPKGTVRPDEILRLLGLDAEAVARANIRRTEIRLG